MNTYKLLCDIFIFIENLMVISLDYYLYNIISTGRICVAVDVAWFIFGLAVAATIVCIAATIKFYIYEYKNRHK